MNDFLKTLTNFSKGTSTVITGVATFIGTCLGMVDLVRKNGTNLGWLIFGLSLAVMLACCLIIMTARKKGILGNKPPPYVYSRHVRTGAGVSMLFVVSGGIVVFIWLNYIPPPPSGKFRILICEVNDQHGDSSNFSEKLYTELRKFAPVTDDFEVRVTRKSFDAFDNALASSFATKNKADIFVWGWSSEKAGSMALDVEIELGGKLSPTQRKVERGIDAPPELSSFKVLESEVSRVRRVALTCAILAYREKDDFAKAGPLINEAIQLADANDKTGASELYYLRALGLYETNDFKAALPDFDQAITLNPEMQSAYIARALTRVRCNQPEAALTDFNQAEQLGAEKDAYFYINRSALYGYRKEWSQMEADARRAVDMEKAIGLVIPAANLNLTTALFALGREDEALAVVGALLKVAPNNSLGLEKEEALYERKSDYKAAIEISSKLIEIDKNKSHPFYMRGFANRKAGNNQAAIADYSSALDIDPDFALAYNNRVYALLAVNELDRALSDANAQIHLTPTSLAYSTRADVYLAKNKVIEAKADYRLAISLAANDAEKANYILEAKKRFGSWR